MAQERVESVLEKFNYLLVVVVEPKKITFKVQEPKTHVQKIRIYNPYVFPLFYSLFSTFEGIKIKQNSQTVVAPKSYVEVTLKVFCREKMDSNFEVEVVAQNLQFLKQCGSTSIHCTVKESLPQRGKSTSFYHIAGIVYNVVVFVVVDHLIPVDEILRMSVKSAMCILLITFILLLVFTTFWM